MARSRRRPSSEPVERPADLDRAIPFPPMEAELVRELPDGKEWQYEPKWDGFRGLLENGSGDLRLWSRNARPLLRYFPELESLAKLLPPKSALDGEIVIERKGVLDFDAMQMRLHPAESRVRKLSAEIPARFIAFDVLVWKGEQVWKEPLSKRRTKLGRVARRFELSPATRDRTEALDWLERFEAIGLDGVVAKRLDVAVPPRLTRRRRQGEAGEDGGLRRRRRALEVQARPHRDAAARPVPKGRRDRLRRLGRRRARAPRADRRAGAPVAREGARERRFSEPNRWGGGELEESPIRPELVVEVRYDKVQSNRFRHGTKLIRFRDDKEPEQCTWRELRPPRRRSDSVDSLLGP